MDAGPFETVDQAIHRGHAFFAGRGVEARPNGETYTVRMCGRYAIAPSRADAWATMGEVLSADIEAALWYEWRQVDKKAKEPYARLPWSRQSAATHHGSLMLIIAGDLVP